MTDNSEEIAVLGLSKVTLSMLRRFNQQAAEMFAALKWDEANAAYDPSALIHAVPNGVEYLVDLAEAAHDAESASSALLKKIEEMKAAAARKSPEGVS